MQATTSPTRHAADLPARRLEHEQCPALDVDADRPALQAAAAGLDGDVGSGGHLRVRPSPAIEAAGQELTVERRQARQPARQQGLAIDSGRGRPLEGCSS